MSPNRSPRSTRILPRRGWRRVCLECQYIEPYQSIQFDVSWYFVGSTGHLVSTFLVFHNYHWSYGSILKLQETSNLKNASWIELAKSRISRRLCEYLQFFGHKLPSIGFPSLWEGPVWMPGSAPCRCCREGRRDVTSVMLIGMKCFHLSRDCFTS